MIKIELGDEQKEFIRHRDNYTCQNPKCNKKDSYFHNLWNEWVFIIVHHELHYNDPKVNDPLYIKSFCANCLAEIRVSKRKYFNYCHPYKYVVARLEYDNWTCQISGSTIRKHLTTHHIESRRKISNPNQLFNLITLTENYHKVVHLLKRNFPNIPSKKIVKEIWNNSKNQVIYYHQCQILFPGGNNLIYLR